MTPTHIAARLGSPVDIQLGMLTITRGIEAWMESDPTGGRGRWIGNCLLTRHRHGDWGDIDTEDHAINNASVTDGGRLLSAYTHPSEDTTIWIITEADRTRTTVLHPSEY